MQGFWAWAHHQPGCGCRPLPSPTSGHYDSLNKIKKTHSLRSVALNAGTIRKQDFPFLKPSVVMAKAVRVRAWDKIKETSLPVQQVVGGRGHSLTETFIS